MMRAASKHPCVTSQHLLCVRSRLVDTVAVLDVTCCFRRRPEREELAEAEEVAKASREKQMMVRPSLVCTTPLPHAQLGDTTLDWSQ